MSIDIFELLDYAQQNMVKRKLETGEDFPPNTQEPNKSYYQILVFS